MSSSRVQISFTGTPGTSFAIRTDFSAYLEGDPLSWVDLTLFSAKPAEIKSIDFEWKDGKSSFSRNINNLALRLPLNEKPPR